MPKSFFYPQWKGNPPIRAGKASTLPIALPMKLVRFIRDNKDHPFFLYLPHYAVHVPN